jgi:hypothetical protein
MAQWCAELETIGYGHSWIEKARNWAGRFLNLIENDHGGEEWLVWCGLGGRLV